MKEDKAAAVTRSRYRDIPKVEMSEVLLPCWSRGWLQMCTFSTSAENDFIHLLSLKILSAGGHATDARQDTHKQRPKIKNCRGAKRVVRSVLTTKIRPPEITRLTLYEETHGRLTKLSSEHKVTISSFSKK